MTTPFPFSVLEALPQALPAGLKPPPWLIHELQQRLVLLLNHVLMQEPAAMQRLQRLHGRQIQVVWQQWDILLQITPAGLFESVEAGEVAPDLVLTVSEPSPWAVAQMLLKGEKPPVRIEGDVQLAAEVQWLADHVRWDVEEDLSRILGDAPAHALAEAGRALLAAVRRFVAGRAERPVESA
jgi:ubiquinone biosynthesis protein UbiJ